MTADALLCYVHINKNAGNSVVEALLANYPDRFRQYLVSGRRSAVAPLAKTVDAPDADVRRVVTEISENQHRYDAVALNLPVGIDRKITRPTRYLTLLREPVDRCVSYWHWAYKKRARGGLWAALQAGLSDGVAGLPLQFRNDQVRFLSGTANADVTAEDLAAAVRTIEERFAFVGTVERFAECREVMARLLSWRQPPTFHLDRGDRRDPRLLPPGLVDRFHIANVWDRELHQWVTRSYLPSMLARAGRR